MFWAFQRYYDVVEFNLYCPYNVFIQVLKFTSKFTKALFISCLHQLLRLFVINSFNFQDVFKIVQDKGLIHSNLSEKDIELRLSEVLDTEILEPVMRLYRVYQFTKKFKSCDRQLLCTLNNKQEAGLKPTSTRLSR